LLEARERLPDPGLPGDVAARLEDGDVRRLGAVAERPQDPLVGLVGRVAGDRELLEPAAGDARRGVDADDGEHQPAAGDEQPVADDDPGEVFEHSLR
jgi:hypothetical protein